MKKTLFTLVLFLMCMTTFATINITDGTVNCLKGQQQIDVTLDLSGTKYLGTRPLSDFLSLASRANDWEEKSLRAFSFSFNQVSRKYGLLSAPVRTASKYVLCICPSSVDAKGRLKGTATLRDSETSESVATFSFATSDGDNDDDITFQDPLSELGEDMAKLLKKQIK